MKQLVLREPAAVLTASGTDAFSFLQSQGSQDLRGLQPGGSTYGLWLDRKGKIQGDSQILRLEEDRFLLVSHATPASVLLDRLQANLVADEVDFADVTPGHLLMTSWGGGDGELTDRNFATETNGGVLSWPGRLAPGLSVERLGPASDILRFSEELCRTGYQKADLSSLEFERVSAGIPMVPIDAGNNTLPQEAMLDKDAVSFTKGCYLGQEVMARLHSLGKAQRRLCKVRLSSPAHVLPQPLTTAQGREIGMLTSQASRLGVWVGLAVLSLRHLPEDGKIMMELDDVQIVE